MDIWENSINRQRKSITGETASGAASKIKRVTTGAKKVPIVNLRQQTTSQKGDMILHFSPLGQKAKNNSSGSA